MTVLEPGPGMGYFTLELARRVGESGRVIALDVQEGMLRALRRRARRAGLGQVIDARLCPHDSLGIKEMDASVDFILAFAMVHELPAADVFFRESMAALKPGGVLLLAEPSGHVSAATFEAERAAAAQAGFLTLDDTRIRRCHSALLGKPAAGHAGR
jgi:ubiquinone/menaquinone biosynthesis C-methylase UbiE